MYSALVTALSNMLSNFFKLKTTQIENQSEINIIEDKKDYKKATDIAEKIIEIAKKYKKEMTFKDRLQLFRLCEKFQKYN